jgi:hypothetical protein
MNDQFASVGRTEVLANLTSISTPTKVSTADGVLRSANTPFEQRIAAVRNDTRNNVLHNSCGGNSGAWGN